MAKTAVTKITKIHVELTADELQAVITLTENQLFRAKFIDPKMPGHKGNSEEVRAAESALYTLRAATNKQHPVKKPGPSDIRLRANSKTS